MAKIATVPNKILRQKSKPVEVDKKTLELVRTLRETLTDKKGKPKGVGLAAVQIGIPKRVFVAFSPASRKLLVFINPKIAWRSKRQTNKKEKRYEGCLSIPNVWAIIQRPKTIKIKYQTESGQTQTRKFTAPLATVIQHEYDHLEGILFTDRALEQKAKLYELKRDEEDKEYFEEIEIE